MASVVTTSCQFQTGVSTNYTCVDPVNPNGYPVAFNTQKNITLAAGGGANGINKGCALLLVMPASGSSTFNLNTGAITGSNAGVMVYPSTGGATFTTTGLNLVELDLLPGGSQTVTVVPGASNGFVGPFSSSGVTLQNSPTGGGGGMRFHCASSTGWPVSSSLANLVIANSDTINASTFTLNFEGQ